MVSPEMVLAHCEDIGELALAIPISYLMVTFRSSSIPEFRSRGMTHECSHPGT